VIHQTEIDVCNVLTQNTWSISTVTNSELHTMLLFKWTRKCLYTEGKKIAVNYKFSSGSNICFRLYCKSNEWCLFFYL